MNKLIFVAVLLSSCTPAIMFAASDYSWGMSQSSTSHQSGGMGAGMMAGSSEGSGMMTPPPRPPMGSGSDMDRPPRPPMGSGGMMGASMMEHEMKGLHMAMKQLSPADHATLMKMMNDYLLSKGIDPAKYAEMRDEIKDMRQENRTEMKDMRKQNQQEMKAKREEMRSKIKEVRGNGKVNVQDISMTR